MASFLNSLASMGESLSTSLATGMSGLTAGNEMVVAYQPDAFVVIGISGRNRIRAMNVPPEVHAALSRLDQEIQAKTGTATDPLHEHYGTLKMQVGPGWLTFAQGGGKEQGTLGKYFVLRLFEEMYALGFNLVVSSDLARVGDNATWFFTKSSAPQGSRRTRVCCIAPGGATNDKLTLLRHDEHVQQAVLLAIADCWPKGIVHAQAASAAGENLTEIKLNGRWGWTHDDGINTRKLICNMVGRMGGLNWRLIAATNLKGTTDSYFFMHDPPYTAHPNDMVMIALCKMDRMRMINCNHLFPQLQTALSIAGLNIQENIDYYGCLEVKIQGTPWHSSNIEAIQARRAISRVLEMMAAHGYVPYYAIDVSKSDTDKASILFKKEPHPMNCKFACLALTGVNRIRLLDFPLDVGVPMRECIYQCYPFGVQNEVPLPDCNLEINLNGWPWQSYEPEKGAASFHAKAMLGRMMRIAEQHGWFCVLSADVSCKTEPGPGHHGHTSIHDRHGHQDNRRPVDVHTLYFMKVNAPS